MLAVQCAAPKSLVAIEREIPVRLPGEVLLRMKRVGICGTDMHIFAGDQPYFEYPRVIGHELSAEVADADAGSDLTPGDLVFVNPYIACGTCHACRQGKTNCCMSLQVLGVHRDGGLSEFLAVPRANVFRADGLDADQAAMVEFLAIGAHAVSRAGVRPGARVLVTGGGPIGIGVAIFAGLNGAEVTVMDTRDGRLDFSRRELGVTTVRAGEGAEQDLLRLTDGAMFDAVFDATGSPAAMEGGFRNVAHGGTFVLVSIVKGRISFDDPEFHKRETTLLSSRNALPADFDRVVQAMREGRVPTGALRSRVVDMAELPARMPELCDPAAGIVKALVAVG